MKKVENIKEIDLTPFDDFEYENFRLIDMYSDYGDITGIQIIRRFIMHCNKHFGKLNESIKEFIRLYTDLSEMMEEHEAFIKAWNDMVDKNNQFVEEVKQLLDDWIDDPRVQKWITDRLDKMIADELPKKLDKSIFYKFKDDFDSFMFGVDFRHRKVRYKDTDVVFVDVMKRNKDGSKNILKRGFAKNKWNEKETVTEFSNRNKPFIAVNASLFGTNAFYGKQAHNGEIIVDRNTERELLALNDKGEMKHYSGDTPMKQMFDEGFTTVLTTFYPLIKDGIEVHDRYSSLDNYNMKAQRTAIGELDDRYVFVLTGGRQTGDVGLTGSELANVIKGYYGKGFKLLFNLDGGGSTQGVLSGVNLVKFGDGGFKEQREVPDFLYIDTKKDGVYERQHNLGRLIDSELVDIKKKIIDLNAGDIKEDANLDLNNIKETSIDYACSGAKGKPYPNTVGFVLTFAYQYGVLQQTFLPIDVNHNEHIFVRNGEQDSGWGSWRAINKGLVGDAPSNDLNKIKVSGDFYANSSTKNKPADVVGFVEQKVYIWGGSIQKFTVYNDTGFGDVYMRKGSKEKSNDYSSPIDWKGWVKIK